MKTLNLAVKTAVEIAPGVYDSASEIVTIQGVDRGLYVQALGLPASMQNIPPKSVKLHFYAKGFVSRTDRYAVPNLTGTLDIDRSVFPTAGDVEIYAGGPTIGTSDYANYSINYWRTADCLEKLLNGTVIGFYGYESSLGDYIAKSVSVYSAASQSHAPYLEISYEEGTLTTYGDSPAGFIDRTTAQTFRWHTAWSMYPVDDIAQTSAVLQWKDGESGTVHEISISGSTASYTMAANTLPVSGDIQWRVNAVTAEGNSEGRWAHLRTQDALSAPVGVAPSSGYVNGTDAVRFIWRHEIETGTEQTGWELQVKGTGDWTALASGSGSEQYYDAPAGSVPSGAVQWRVRTLNAQGTAGSWSEPLQIVVIGAPTVTALQVVTASPRPEVTWASPDQQAFQIRMGSYDSGLVFGTQKRYKCPVYLSGTGAEIRVRVINEYRIWSDWASITVTFANTPGSAPVLSVEAGRDAVLSWGAVTNAAAYQIWRDGVHIGTTAETGYTDQLAAPGWHSWYIRAVYAANDNYTDSNAVQAEVRTDSVIIAALGGEWIDIGRTATVSDDTGESRSAGVALLQLAGTVYPTPEVSPRRQRSYQIAFGTEDPAEADRFEELIGKICVLKTRHGRQYVGIMSSVSRSQNWAITRCSAVLQEVDESAYR